jgi:hypothetical protein
VSVEDAMAECVATYRRWLHVPDPGGLHLTLGTVAANLAPGDPVWVGIVAPPSAGKTETMGPVGRLPYVHPVATLTEAALLSGTPSREHKNGAKGGLLRSIGEFGIILCKDFTSILAQNRDTRAAVLAALREIYDGSWTRHVGTDGGRTLHWAGKVGLVAGCTPAIDLHHGVIAAMGERMTLYRMPTADAAASAGDALRHIGNEVAMRNQLSAAALAVLEAGDHGRKPGDLALAELGRLVDLSTFAVRCRSAVERDGYTREVLMLPEAEGPARLATVLRRLLHGLETVGVAAADRWALLAKVAADCMPASRWLLLSWLVGCTAPTTTAAVAIGTGLPTQTSRRHLEDLALLGVVERTKAGAHDNSPDQWALSPWTRSHWPDPSVPESPGGAQ